jgi:hypothetical protein
VGGNDVYEMVRFLAVLVACALLVAACGSSSRTGSIQSPVAKRLAAESDQIAARLRAGDGCGAAQLARKLQQDVRTAAPRLRASVDGIAAEIVCVPAAPQQPVVQPEPAPGHGHGKAKGHHKHGHG